MENDGASTEDSTGNPSLDGWFYQCDVSVWAALDLLVVKRVATALQLEPASQEDLEAELDAPIATSNAKIDGETLIIQAKLRRSGQWTPATLRRLVEHGNHRPSALKRLEVKSARYLLATSADVSKELQSLVVEDFIEAPTAFTLPDCVFPPSHVKGAAGRFAILGVHTEQRVKERIDLLLMNPLCVPLGRQEKCREHLRKEAIARMRSGNVWLRAEVEDVVKAFDGTIASEHADEFVEPDCWHSILRQMDEQHAIVLTGPSGTGKTTVANALARHFKGQVPGLGFVVAQTPAEVRRGNDSTPTLYYFEDPWGKYEITQGRLAWSSELEQMLPHASTRQMFVVTSRLDILTEAVGDEPAFLKRWEVRLEPDDYGPKQKRLLYENRIPRLSSGVLQTAAVAARERVLQQLTTPFEIDRFFDRLKAGPSEDDKSETNFVARVLHETQRDSIEQEVKALVETRHAVHCAAVIWGLMTARGGLSRGDLPGIRRGLMTQDQSFRTGLEELVNALIAGGSLRQPSSDVTYAHPRVEAGLVGAMRTKSGVTEDALLALTNALVRMDKGQSGRGTETAAKVYAAMVTASPRWGEVSEEVGAAIDKWLEVALGQDAEDYASLLRLAATVGSEHSIPAEVARWLRPASSGAHFFMRNWKVPSQTDEWYAAARAHPATKAICERFIRHVMTVETRGYPKRISEYMDRFVEGLDEAWCNAGFAVVPRGYAPNVEAIAFGAMRFAPTREPLMLAALDIVLATHSSIEPDADHWSYIDGHFNGDYGDSFGDHDDDHSAQELVSAYVVATRRDVGWQALATHARLPDLCSFWLDELRWVDAEEVCDEEMMTVFDAVRGLPLEAAAWALLEDKWRPVFEARMRTRLCEGHDDADVRQTVVRCALKQAATLLDEQARALSSARDEVRLLELAFDAFWSVMQAAGRKKRMHHYHGFARSLPDPFSEVALAFTPYDKLRRTQLSIAGRELVVAMLGRHDGYLRVFLVWLATVNGLGSREAIRNAIIDSEASSEAIVGLRAAIAIELWDVVGEALTHPRADVRQLAFEATVEHNHGVVPSSMFGLVADQGHRVRRALVDALASQPERGLDVLTRLCSDTWSEHSVPDHEDPSYPIALRAAKAIGQLDKIPAEYTEQLLKAALETSDSKVCATLFEALAEHGDEAAQLGLSQEAFTVRPSWTSVSAARALALAGPRVNPILVAGASQQWFHRAQASLAVNMALAIGTCAQPAQIRDTARWFAESETRRVLLIPMVLGTQTRDEELASEIMGYLPPDHPAKSLFGSDDTLKLPHDVLDDLGDIRIVNAALCWCMEKIEARPRATITA